MIIIKQIYYDNKQSYIEKYGYHFNEKSLEFAVSHMYKLDKENKEEHINPLTQDILTNLINKYQIKIHNYHLYDCLYVLNMAKADFLGSSIKDEEHLILYVKDLIDDPDGYEGLVFNRWRADLEGKHIDIDWNDFI